VTSIWNWNPRLTRLHEDRHEVVFLWLFLLGRQARQKRSRRRPWRR
jgi:hypothetical protein